MKQSKQTHAEKHLHCQMELRNKWPHIGLYCKEHDTWIQWITGYQAGVLKNTTDITYAKKKSMREIEDELGI